jgi:hypothetical protein
MWLPAAMTALAIVFLGFLANSLSKSAEAKDECPPENDSSVLRYETVQRSIEAGAPPTPWVLRREDHEAMARLKAMFARAIPNPEGRPFIDETLGHGGPQLELRVPILRTHKPIAVLARSWDPVDSLLESTIFFFGTVDERLEKLLLKYGFEYSSSTTEFTAFRNHQDFTRRRVFSVRSFLPQRDRETA